MRKVLVTFVLALTGAVLAQGSTQPAASDQQANSPTSQKVIKDPAEYNAYITAYNTQDPAAKAQALEAFIAQYPQSIVLSDALDLAMAAYQQTSNIPKVVELAKRILALTPNNIRVLAIVTAIDRDLATGGNAAALKEGCAYAQSGLQQLPNAQKPEGLSDADFEKQRNQMADFFNGTAGFCALQSKNYTEARPYYLKALQLDPTNMQDTYQLALTYLETNPIDLNGFWFSGKAINLAKTQKNDAAAQGIATYAKAKYKRYHGNTDNWDQFVATTAGQTAPPSLDELGKLITPKPTDCDIAADVVAKNDPATLSFSDWAFVLAQRDCAPKGKAAADKVWQAILNKQKDAKGEPAKLQIEVKVVSADKDTIQAAFADENQKDNKADLKVTLEKPTLKPPVPGTMIKIVGSISDYTLNPFMFIMTQGELPGVKPPVKKPPVHRAAAKKK